MPLYLCPRRCAAFVIKIFQFKIMNLLIIIYNIIFAIVQSTVSDLLKDSNPLGTLIYFSKKMAKIVSSQNGTKFHQI